MQISERGQVTIPQSLRERFGLLPHVEVEFLVREGGVMLVRSEQKVHQAFQDLYGKKKFHASTDDLMRMLRD